MIRTEPKKSFTEVAATLRQQDTPFAVATIVRTLASTAAKPGMKAILLGNGEFAEGWLGGACVTSAVSKAAIKAIQTGAPTLVCLRPEALFADAKAARAVAGAEAEANHEVQLARNGCPSEGSMDIFVEPVVPQPELLIFGQGPVAQALLHIASGFDFRLSLCGEIQAISGERIFADIDALKMAEWSKAPLYVVVATQGNRDLASLTQALTMKPKYLAFVGSRKKFLSYGEKLGKAGIAPADINNVSSPAGLDISAVKPEEIALSIMAEVVSAHRLADARVESSGA